MSLRDYQRDAYDCLRKGWAGGLRRIGISLPTGVGKTHIMAHLAAEEARDMSDNRRILFLVHRDELVHQTVAKLQATVDPGTSIGVLKGPRNEIGARIIVASVHSLRSEKRRLQLPPIKLCIVDEAHVSVSPTYKDVFRALRALENDGTRLAGFSATWVRSDDTGLGDVWEEIVFSRTIKWAIAQGHLVSPKPVIQVGAGVDLSDVREDKTKGDYRESDLGKAVMLEELRDTVVAGALRYEPHRPSVLFAPTVEAAEFFADGLRVAGLSTEGIYGTVSGAQRRPIFDRHRNGETKILTTCTALAEGWDAPYASRLLLVRPTKHEGLFIQIVGRFLRRYPGKSNAVLLDFVGATSDLKLRNAIDLSESVLKDIDGELQELLDEEPTEPVTRERIVKQKRSSYEVDIFAGTSVQWLMGPSNIPFVPCGDQGVVFIVQGRDGWHVGQAKGWCADGRPDGDFIHSGLNETDALAAASDHVENANLAVARKSARWRNEEPTDAQKNWARTLGIVGAENMTKGALSDEISVAQATGVLVYFARWSRSQV